MKEKQLTTYTLPPPIGGIDKYNALDNMPAQNCYEMENIFPEFQKVRVRGGSAEDSTGMGSGPIYGAWELVLANGTKQLVMAANNKLYKRGASGGAATDITGTTTPTSNLWEGVVFKHRLFLVNGTNTAQIYDGSTTTDLSITGIAASSLKYVATYKSRIYFVEKDSANIWYLASSAITGAATKLDVSDILEKGGYVVACGQYNNQGTSSAQNLFVIISSEGEVLVYSGANPGATDWVLVAKFFVDQLVGNRPIVRFENDLIMMTKTDIIPISSLFQGNLLYAQTTLSDNVRDLYVESLSSGLQGNQLCYWPKGNMLIANIPTGATDSIQIIMNTSTGAWTKFSYQGAKPCCWVVFDSNLYFGSFAGKLYLAESGDQDAAGGGDIDFSYKQAWNFFGTRSQIKKMLDCRPLLELSGEVSIGVSANFDFKDATGTNAVTITAPTGIYQNFERFSLEGQGHSVSIEVRGTLSSGTLAINGLDLGIEFGGRI